VRLHDGSMSTSDSEAWRHECEARAVLRMMPERRAVYLADVVRLRGQGEAERLRATMAALRPAAKAGRPTR
jgi:hypothetical protein